MAETEEYSVERILSHKRYKRLVKDDTMQAGLAYRQNQRLFLIKWEGYDDPKDYTWEPRENIEHLELFRTYIKKHDLPFDDEGDEKDIVTLKRPSPPNGVASEHKKPRVEDDDEEEARKKCKEERRKEKEAQRLKEQEEEECRRRKEEKRKRKEQELFEKQKAEEEAKRIQFELEREEERKRRREAKKREAEELKKREQEADERRRMKELERQKKKPFIQLCESSELSESDEEWSKPSTSSVAQNEPAKKPEEIVKKSENQPKKPSSDEKASKYETNGFSSFISAKPEVKQEKPAVVTSKPSTDDLEEEERRKKKHERRERKERERLQAQRREKANAEISVKPSTESKENLGKIENRTSSTSSIKSLSEETSKSDERLKKPKEKNEKSASMPTFIDIFSSDPSTSIDKSQVNGVKEKASFKIPKRVEAKQETSKPSTMEVKNDDKAARKQAIKAFKIPTKISEDPIIKFKKMVSIITNGVLVLNTTGNQEDERVVASIRMFVDNYSWFVKQLKRIKNPRDRLRMIATIRPLLNKINRTSLSAS